MASIAGPLALLLAAAALLSQPLGGVAQVKVGKHVTKLTQEKFDYLMKQPDDQRPAMLVEFFAPWCQACKSFAPTYGRVAQMVKEDKLDVKVVAIDAVQHEELGKRYGVSSYPTIFFFPQSGRPMRFGEGVPSNPTVVMEWLRKLQGPAIAQVSSPEEAPLEPGSMPAVIITAPIVPKNLKLLAQANRLTANWYWVLGFGDVIVEMRRWQEPPAVFEWSRRASKEEEEEDLLMAFGQFYLEHRLPSFGRVDEPKKFQESRELHTQAPGVVWVLLNSSDMIGPAAEEGGAAEPPHNGREDTASESCSARGGGAESAAQQCSGGALAGGALSAAAADAAANDRLEDAVQALRPMMLKAAKRLKKPKDWGLKQNYSVVYVDAARHAAWAESALAAWSFPSLIVQRCTLGCGAFHFADGGRLPGNVTELSGFVKATEDALSKLRPRQKTERPPEPWEAQPIKKLVAFNAEQELRSVPGTLLYMTRLNRYDESDDVVVEEREALEELAAWLAKVCEKPPVVAQFDADRNEIPISLYSSGDMSTLPGLFFVPNDGAEPGTFPWRADINRFDTPPKYEIPKLDDTNDPKKMEEVKRPAPHRPLSKDLNAVAQWALEQARNVSGLSVPDSVSGHQLAGFEAGGTVTDLGPNTIQGFLANSKVAFVKFYAPWCFHCKELEPTFFAAARAARRETDTIISQVAFGRLDASGNNSRWAETTYGVDSYPVLLLFRQGEDVVRFEAQRMPKNRKQVLAWLRFQLKPALQDVASEAEIKARKAIVFRGGNRSLALQVANDYRQRYNFFFAVKGVDAEEETPSLVALDPTDGQRAAFSGNFEYNEIVMWILEIHMRSEPPPATQPGPVIKVVGKTFREVVYGTTGHIIIEIFAPWCGHCKELQPIYEQFAEKMRSERRDVVVAKFDGTANDIVYDGFSYNGFPTVFHIAPDGAISTISARTLKDLEAFVVSKRIPRLPAKASTKKELDTNSDLDDLLSNMKSEAVPTSQTGLIIKVVLKSFANLVFRKYSDVILEIYSPTCPHCMKLDPHYESFAQDIVKKYGNKIVVAKIDGTANEIPFKGFDIKGYPTLFYVAAGEKEPVKSFVGSDCIDKMLSYVKTRPKQ